MNRFDFENYPNIDPSEPDQDRTLSRLDFMNVKVQALEQELADREVDPSGMVDILNASLKGKMEGLSRDVAIGPTKRRSDPEVGTFRIECRPDQDTVFIIAPGINSPKRDMLVARENKKEFVLPVVSRLIDLYRHVERNEDSSKTPKDTKEVREKRLALAASIVEHAVGLVAHGEPNSEAVNSNVKAFAEFVFPDGSLGVDADMSDGTKYFAAYSGFEEKVYALIIACVEKGAPIEERA